MTIQITILIKIKCTADQIRLLKPKYAVFRNTLYLKVYLKIKEKTFVFKNFKFGFSLLHTS